VERAVRALLAIVVLTLSLWMGGAAAAQSAPVSLRLVRQSPWNSAYSHPLLRIAVDATNIGSRSFSDLSIGLTIGANYESRVEYESSLDEGPTTGIFETERPVRGTLDPLLTRTIRIHLDLSQTSEIDQAENLVYPARVEIRSGNTVIASLTTPILYFVRKPEAPMHFSWWIEMAPTIAFGADGRLDATGFADALGAGGQLGAPIAALDQAIRERGGTSHIPMGLVVTPSLVDQVQRMVGGYTRADGTFVPPGEDGAANAAEFLATLKEVMNGPGIRTVAPPFSGPTIPSMLASGLEQDLDDQRTLGIDTIENLSGTTLLGDVARPPAGALSEDSLDWLARNGVTTLLGDTGTVDRTDEASVSEPAPTATLPTPNGSMLTAILPDPGTESLLERPDLLSDPVRAAQAVLGELAVIWKEAPVPDPPNVRGRALALPTSILPPGLWTPLLERFHHTPFLQIQDPAAFAASVYPPGAVSAIRSPDETSFPTSYTEGPSGIHGLHTQIVDYRSMLTQESHVPDELTRDLYYAESALYVGDPSSGEPWLTAVHTATRAAFDSVRPQVGQGFTFTSGEGSIPLLMGDPGPIPLRVTIRLESSQFTYPGGSQQDVVLSHPNQVVTFRIVAKAAGQNPIAVRVLAPNGDGIGEPQYIVVRSTAFNHIALIVTLAAAGMLALLYSRRWFRRTKVPS
jgi:hypothetical protein